MKWVKLLGLLAFVIFFSVGCVNTANDATHQIVSPENLDIAIQGTWEVTQILTQKTPSSNEDLQLWLEKTLQFSSEYAVIGDTVLKNPRYQIKRVDSEEYLLYHNKAFPKGFSFTEKEIEVFTITAQDIFFCEILREKDGELLLKLYNDTYLLTKISDEVDEELIYRLEAEGLASENIEQDREDDLIRTGVLIGLRSVIEEQGIQRHQYRTLWIGASNKSLHPLLETQDLFYPRRSGFWKMESILMTQENRWEELLITYNILAKDITRIQDLSERSMVEDEDTKTITRGINYIGNDYVSIEEKILRTDQGNGQERLQNNLRILPIDSLPSIKGVKIDDLLGDPGAEAVDYFQQQLLGQNKEQPIEWIDEATFGFGLERRLGHWFFKGRINYVRNEGLFAADYNINLIPPSKVVFYDELNIPWKDVKDRIPSTVDLFTSPNRDIALVVTKTELIVFPIDRGKLKEEPLARIPLRKGEAVIMAEWAMGTYVENWEKTLKNHIQDVQ